MASASAPSLSTGRVVWTVRTRPPQSLPVAVHRSSSVRTIFRLKKRLSRRAVEVLDACRSQAPHEVLGPLRRPVGGVGALPARHRTPRQSPVSCIEGLPSGRS